MKTAMARPLSAIGSVVLIIGALLPWATFVLNDGPYPDKATLEFFDAPFGLSSFRLYLEILGLAGIVFTFVPVRDKIRVLKSIGWGAAGISVVNLLFIAGDGGGLGAITAADGVPAFGSIVAVVGSAVLLFGAYQLPPEPLTVIDSKLPWWAEWLILLAAFVALLFLITETLTAGGHSGVSDPYIGPLFLSYLSAVGALLGVLHAFGVTEWISDMSERHRVFSIVVLVLCAVAVPFTSVGNDYWMTITANIGVYAATAIGLNIVVGLAGLLDLGYVAFMGIGAFVAANLSGAVAAEFHIQLPFIVAAIASGIVAGVFGAVVGSPTLRVRGDYLAIVTLAFGEIFVRVSQNNIGGLTGGSNAIPNIPDLSLFGAQFNDAPTIGGLQLPGGVLYYFLIVLLVALVMFVFGNLKNSRIGRAWIAIREDEDVARAMGVKTGKLKILAFMTGATLAGLAGAVFAHKLATASYDSFQFNQSVTLLAAVILGGMGTIPGAVLGAALLFVLPEELRQFKDYRLLFFGLALVVIMRFRPQGLIADRHRRAELADEDTTGESLDDTAIKEPVAVAAKEAGA
ncbi:branched-chain amino acid ABC transporter permease [Kutzneria buriramensis]|uniref:Branched-chain amino acid transport system permease protein n=1 Tax=Kutzneria buriramensis TaxID=1045776 RepID=A0A3E0HQ74_9PSEU|nr:branched-chain amino acid ABC transporter permease [Kutzneria buriramensis]REH48410.1 branched-chain amino acid transport system permease protein [Kutzneria buriramensis]